MIPRHRAGARPRPALSGTKRAIAPSLLSVSIAAALGSVGSFAYVPKAHAQEAAPNQALEEVVVTGSRIVRRDNSSNSPIVTIEADQFQAQMGLNFEAYLNQLPEYNPAASPTTSQGDVQITPVNSVGIASISLRGLGPNRSLVLVNGKRTVPINALMVTDVNSIPSALVQRVETITGGASAVYGADAIGGVTNFILRDNFQGIQIDSQYGATETGDGAETRLSAVFGANSSDGKGNIAIGAEYYNRDAALAVNNDFYTARYNDPYAAGLLRVPAGHEPTSTASPPARARARSTACSSRRPARACSARQARRSSAPSRSTQDGTVFVPAAPRVWRSTTRQ